MSSACRHLTQLGSSVQVFVPMQDLHFGMGIWRKLVGMRRPVNALVSPWLKPIEFDLQVLVD